MNAYLLEDRIEHPITFPLVRCPACGSGRLDPVVEDVVQEVHFLCRDCDRCWNVAMGHVQRVAPRCASTAPNAAAVSARTRPSTR